MENTRVEKFKEYRKSFLKEESSIKNSSIESLSSEESTSLPMDQVMEKIEKNKITKFKDFLEGNRYFLKVIAVTVFMILAVVGIVLWIITLAR